MSDDVKFTEEAREYNKDSHRKYDWKFEWFDAPPGRHGEELFEAVKKKQEEWGVTVDGLIGPITYRRIMVEREEESAIICGGKRVEVEWDSVVNIHHPKALLLKDGFNRESDRTPTMVVTHWDVCTSSEQCHRVLQRAGISSHFSIDNDGTIYQYLDTSHIAWHAGVKSVNRASIGIDLTNGYYLKYNETYRKRGFGLRPIIKSLEINGHQTGDFLGFYPVQVEAYKALLRALCDHYNIPLAYPQDKQGNLLNKLLPEAARGEFEGIIGHYHCKKTKKDPASLRIDQVVDELKAERDLNLDNLAKLMRND